MILKGLLIITILIVLPLESYALSPFYSFRHIYEESNDSPSPSPSHGINLVSGGSSFQNSCNGASRSCWTKNMAACFTYFRSGPHEEICLLVQSNGENDLHVSIIILPANNTIKEINLKSHEMHKINISSDVDLRSSAIALNTSDGACVIHAAAPAPETHSQKYSSYRTYITPINGAYVIILLFMVGGSVIFFKLRMRGRHLDGVPYHELEMGNSTALSSLDAEENEPENWDQDWDDEWGDEKPVKSGGENSLKIRQANGLTTNFSKSNGRIKEWND